MFVEGFLGREASCGTNCPKSFDPWELVTSNKHQAPTMPALVIFWLAEHLIHNRNFPNVKGLTDLHCIKSLEMCET